jgi:N-acetylmuramoyl-L-alanine amidase
MPVRPADRLRLFGTAGRPGKSGRPANMGQMQRIESPNHDARPDGGVIDILLIHYTGMLGGASAAIGRLTDPAAKVSAHYVVDVDGGITALVPEDRRAWHAGVASWLGATDINARSVGIEVDNPGHEYGYLPFSDRQISAVEELAREILARHPIPPQRVLGHADVAPTRKADPGELFPWERLARAGIGVWPAPEASVPGEPVAVGPGDSGEGVARFQDALARFGYGITTSGGFDEETVAVAIAFQRHFRPLKVDGIADSETQARLFDLARRYG